MARGRSPGPGPSRSAPTARDCRKYAREFVRTDTDGDGFITAQEARALFERSGLGNEVLLCIWELVDVSRAGRLGFSEFVAAMHLIGLSLAGQMPPPPAAGLPPALGDFLRNFRASPQQLAVEGTSRSASASRSRSATPRGSAARLAPSRRDCRKYAREFQRLDADRDGAVTAGEARELFLRSGLGNEVLRQVYDLSDRGRSGLLGFPEFVAAMHLIRMALGGFPPPPDASALPRELEAFLAGLHESPAELAREGSSRSASRARAEAPPFSAPGSPPQADLQAPATAPAASPFDTAPLDFEQRPPPDSQELQMDFPGSGHRKEKRKKDRRHGRRGEEQAQDFPAAGPPALDTGLAGFGSSSPSIPGTAPSLGWEGPPVATAGSCGGAFGALDAEPARGPGPPTRMGLPIPDPGGGCSALDGADGLDPCYAARVREILGLPDTGARPAGDEAVMPAPRAPATGALCALGPPRTAPGDYDSPVMRSVLIGARPAPAGGAGRSKAAEAAVLPPSSTPFLRTIAPNYRTGGEPAGAQRPQLPISSSGKPLAGLLGGSVPAARVLREQLSTLPTAAYASRVST